MGIWVVSTFWLLCTVLLNAIVLILESLLSVPIATLHYVIILCLTFGVPWRNPIPVVFTYLHFWFLIFFAGAAFKEGRCSSHHLCQPFLGLLLS